MANAGRWAILTAGLAVSCGGSGSSSSDGDLQQADVDQIVATLTSALSSVSSTPTGVAASGAVAAYAEREVALSQSVPLNFTTACPAGGHVTTTGNFSVNCPTPPATGACSFAGLAKINYGDVTNNLNDCAFDNGLIVDGGLTLSMTGNGAGTNVNLTETLTGTLSLNRKGPTGGLVPINIGGIHACIIFLTAKFPARTITGSVCNQSVNATY